MASLEIFLLGPLQLQLEGQPLSGFKTRKACALLAYLAAENDRSHSRETIADLFWPDLEHNSAMGDLRNALSNLRKVLKEPPGNNLLASDPNLFLLVLRDNLQFNRDSDSWIDVDNFTKMLKQDKGGSPNIDRLEQAVRLYRGPFMEGFFLPENNAFDEWLMLKREHLERMMQQTLYNLTKHYIDLGNYELAQEYADRQILLEPWLEEAHQQMMIILASNGRRSAALAQFSICRRSLANELGVSPSQDTIRLYEMIRDGKLKSVVQRQIQH